jgi:hypothetical protein
VNYITVSGLAIFTHYVKKQIFKHLLIELTNYSRYCRIQSES